VTSNRAAFLLPVAAALLVLIAGCASVNEPAVAPGEVIPTSVQTIEYYPYQVKGYQNSYPRRSVMVLIPVDDREFLGIAPADHAPLDGNAAIGVTIGKDGNVIKRLYSAPLPDVVQKAIAGSAREAGLTPELATGQDYQSGRTFKADYVIASRIKRCWVTKRRGIDNRFGPMWNTAADFAIDIVVYKPPFSVPFWQGVNQANYNDPPVGSFGLGPEDEAGIYDEPGQVLSVAMTRAIAGIFERPDFRTLITQDEIRSH